MKGILTVIWKKLMGLVFGIFGLCKRMICRCRRTRRNSGSLLPVTNKVTVASEVNQSVPSNEIELESWDSWGAEENKPLGINEQQHFHFNQSNAAAHMSSTNHMHQKLPHVNNAVRHSISVEAEQEPEPDFFQDMTPHLQRTKKVFLKKKEKEPISPMGLSSRLAFNNDVPIQDGLGTWDDDNAWEGDADEDLTWEAEAVVKDKKRQERLMRQNEQRRKKQEKELQRTTKRESGHTLAVKLS